MENNPAYVARLPFARGFNKEQAPAFLDHVCIANGFAPPPGSPVGEGVGSEFSWCELHAGTALTATLLAAANPGGEFHVVDPRAAAHDAGKALAGEGEVRNINFHTQSVDAAMNNRFGPFDYIAVHGVYSWVPLRERALVLAFVRKFLKPGGAVYVSYNARPGWNRLDAFRRIFRESARGMRVTPAERLARAREIYALLHKAKAPAVVGGAPPLALADLAKLPPDALETDYANEFSDPLYVTEVMSDFAAIGCALAGPAELARSAAVLAAHEPFKSLFARVPAPAGRELAKDYVLDTQFRADVFVRGGQRLAADGREAVLSGLAFALEQPAVMVRYRARLPFGEMTFDNPHARALVAALREGPRTLQQLIEARAESATPDNVVANVNALVMCGQIRPVYRPTREADASARALQGAIRARATTDSAIGFLPCAAGTAFPVLALDQIFLSAPKGATGALVRFASESHDREGNLPNAVAGEDLAKSAKAFLRRGRYYASLGLGGFA